MYTFRAQTNSRSILPQFAVSRFNPTVSQSERRAPIRRRRFSSLSRNRRR
ncbi:hypothetical protein CASFOL_042445 [Castilleja foliolosa]|uniref:Uncharacterized protein n=1 Tax=Castilleja foliolosa TaxID=1961234 RepID=A0ABD3BBC5_9LAMI